jgi:hypothetical protein
LASERSAAFDPACVKTESDLVVIPCGAPIFAFFRSPCDHTLQNSWCIFTAQNFHTAWARRRSGGCVTLMSANRSKQTPFAHTEFFSSWTPLGPADIYPFFRRLWGTCRTVAILGVPDLIQIRCLSTGCFQLLSSPTALKQHLPRQPSRNYRTIGNGSSDDLRQIMAGSGGLA